MDENPVLVDRREGYRIITLNRPQRLNAFNGPMQQALLEAVADTEQDQELPGAAHHRRRTRVLVGPGPERARDSRRAR